MTIETTITQNLQVVEATYDGETKVVEATVEPAVQQVEAEIYQNASLQITGRAFHILKTDRGQPGDPVSGQNIIYLPLDKDYLIFQNYSPLYKDDDYTRDGLMVTLLNGDIAENDKFLLCE